MYVHYNDTLRKKIQGAFVTTLHAINSGIIKLSKLTPACTVYRGVAGGVLPDQFWKPNEHGVMGGIELGFMSTTTERSVAEMYMRQTSKAAKMIFQINMGMIDRGAVRARPSNTSLAPPLSAPSPLPVGAFVGPSVKFSPFPPLSAHGSLRCAPRPAAPPRRAHRTSRCSRNSPPRRRSSSRRSRAWRWRRCRGSRAT